MQTSTTSKINNTLFHQTESDTTFHYSSDFLEWLRTEEISLAISTYQTNKLFLIGRDTTKHLFVSEKSFDRAMGLHVESENSFYLSTRFLLWRFENALAEGQIHKEADKVYIPRQAFNTGDLNVHDVSVDENGEIVFVNTRYNCIAKVSQKYNFKPIWMPPFISKMVAEDRCHLNGMAMRDGKPRYVTAISQSNLLDSWREHRQDGGIVMDMETSEVLVDELSMPHSPRYYQDKIWVLNAGRGEFGYVEDNKFIAITKLDGFLRGLAFHKNYAIIGLSKPRHERTFTGLPLDEILQSRNTEPQCGFWIVDINTGEIVHKFEIKGEVVELYDVQALPNVKRPSSLDLTSADVTRYISIEGDDNTVDFKALTTLDEKSKDSFQSPYSLPQVTSSKNIQKQQESLISSPLQNNNTPILDPNIAATSVEDIKYQIASNIPITQIIKQFNTLTFPRLDLQAKVKKFNEPLLVIVARNQQQYIGAILIESHSNVISRILSWYVLPPFRDLGIGKELLVRAEKVLSQNKFNSLHIKYRSDWKSAEKITSIFKNNNWVKPSVASSLYKFEIEKTAKASWVRKEHRNTDIEMFQWNTLTQAEKQKIQHRQSTTEWYPITVDPFSHEGSRVDILSFGLRYKGEVFGWIIVHSIKTDTVEFGHLFIDKEILGKGLGSYIVFLETLSKSLLKAEEEGYKYGLLQIEQGNATMYKFIDRYLRPDLITETDHISTHKNFNESNSIESNKVSTSKISYKVYQLNVDDAISHFNNLSFPRLDILKTTRQLNEPLIIINAQNDNQQIGTAIIELQPNGSAQLLSWYILPPFRKMGIGRELLSQSEKLLRKNKFNSIHLEYRSDWTSLSTFEHILKQKKWEEPKAKVYLCKSSMDVILKAPWMNKFNLPTGMELFLWKDVTQEEKNEILKKKETQNWYPDYLSPFQHEANIDITSSTGLRYKGKIIGWMITHRIQSDTVEFTSAFIDQNSVAGLNKKSLFLPVLTKALLYLKEDGAKYGIWQMQVDNPSIHKFVDKFLKPYLISFVEAKFSYKVLNS
ncbi:TIGR03032 family protein [Bernardetia sp. OM2101]|uniref:TIGR03032 family protein n=1 Tax=Bernardetia sp. OM2101 TaxID=3344876 RepID=UPI0035D0F92C